MGFSCCGCRFIHFTSKSCLKRRIHACKLSAAVPDMVKSACYMPFIWVLFGYMGLYPHTKINGLKRIIQDIIAYITMACILSK